MGTAGQGIGWQPAACLTGPVYAWVTNILSIERSPGTPLVHIRYSKGMQPLISVLATT
jgi:hypothetical protein